MNARLSIEKNGQILATATYEITNSTELENACRHIWHLVPRKHEEQQFLTDLHDLWGATMQLELA